VKEVDEIGEQKRRTAIKRGRKDGHQLSMASSEGQAKKKPPKASLSA